MCFLLDLFSRRPVQDERKVERGDGEQVWWIEKTEVRSVCIDDDRPMYISVSSIALREMY